MIVGEDGMQKVAYRITVATTGSSLYLKPRYAITPKKGFGFKGIKTEYLTLFDGRRDMA
jgi:hypothetical protein